VNVGPLNLHPAVPVRPGAVKAAIRPEAWTLDESDRVGLPGTVEKQAYLGGFQELTVDTRLGLIFVVCADAGRSCMPGDPVTLRLNGRGVSIVSS
jgi:iron(III) transport system ATP-binding protein